MKMTFGTKVLSLTKGLCTQYKMVDGRHRELMVIKVGKFIFERPDNEKMIIEVEGILFEDTPNNVLPFTLSNVDYFETLIQKHFDDKINQEQENLIRLRVQKEAKQANVDALQLNIDNIESNNQIEFSDNRIKASRQISKALRKHKGSIANIDEKLGEHKTKIEKLEIEKKLSLEQVSKKILVIFSEKFCDRCI